MDPEYEAAKASFESAGIQPGNAEFSVNEGGVSVETPIETPAISTTEVAPDETAVDAPAETQETAPEGQGAEKVEAPQTEAQKKKGEPSKYQQAQREAREAKERELKQKAEHAEKQSKLEKDLQYWRDVAEGKVPKPVTAPNEPYVEINGEFHTAATLRQAAALLLERGDEVNAEIADKVAKDLEGQSFEQHQAQRQQQQHLANWQTRMEYATRIDPTLLDPKNPITTEISQLLAYPDPLVRGVFENHPDGFYLATEAAKLRLAVSTTQKENEALKAELAKVKSGKTALEQKILPRPAPSPGRAGDRIPTEDEELALARQEYNSLHR